MQWTPAKVVMVATVAAALFMPGGALAATWHYYVPFDTGKSTKDGQPQSGKVFLWLPPATKTVRGLLVGGQLGIELEIVLDAAVRRACAENDLGIVYFAPHLSGVFHYWQDGNPDAKRWLKAFDDLARRSGHPELSRIPWITMGHSTAGIFCRNVAYRWPQRVAGILHIKSGNFHQAEHLPPRGSLAGIPLVAMNGQFETYGPEGGLRPEYGRETQWVFVEKDLQRFQEHDANHLMSLWLDLGGDHFHGSPELSQYAALFIRKTAKYRLQQPPVPLGKDTVPCLPVKREGGWLTDPDLYHPQHAPAADGDYTGDKRKALWHYDQELALATARHHAKLGTHQCLSNPVCTWRDDGDGWTFQVTAEFLDAMPDKYGGRVANQKIGHSSKPFLYRCKITEPVEQVGPDTFRLLRPIKSANIAAVHPGDDDYRATNRWGSIGCPQVKGSAQTMDFPALPDLVVGGRPVNLKAKASSGLPVYYEVDYGPVVVKDGAVVVSELPSQAQLPIECRITAYQIGRRTNPTVPAAAPVSHVFQIVKR